jgi:hypothetical protein
VPRAAPPPAGGKEVCPADEEHGTTRLVRFTTFWSAGVYWVWAPCESAIGATVTPWHTTRVIPAEFTRRVILVIPKQSVQDEYGLRKFNLKVSVAGDPRAYDFGGKGFWIGCRASVRPPKEVTSVLGGNELWGTFGSLDGEFELPDGEGPRSSQTPTREDRL